MKQRIPKKLILIFLLSIIVYAINNLIIKPNHANIFFHNHLNDFLFPFAYLPILMIIKSIIYQQNLVEKVTLKRALLWATVFSVWFEIITPLYQEKATADMQDVLYYFLGALTFYFIDRNRK